MPPANSVDAQSREGAEVLAESRAREAPFGNDDPTDVEFKELLLTGLWNDGCVCISRVWGG